MPKELDREAQLQRLRQRYERRNKEGKCRMLDEFCEQHGYSRKHAINLLGDWRWRTAGLKKSSALSLEARRAMIDCQDELSVRHQCELVGLDRSGFYYEPVGPEPEEIALCHRLDEIYTARPFYGVRRMTSSCSVKVRQSIPNACGVCCGRWG